MSMQENIYPEKKPSIPPSGNQTYDPNVQVVVGSTQLRSHTQADIYVSRVMYCGYMYFHVLIMDMIMIRL